MMDVADPRVRGTAIGIQRMVTDIGQLLGPIVVGLLLDRSTFLVCFAVIGGLVALTAMVTIAMPETRTRPSPRQLAPGQSGAGGSSSRR
jgi:MFS family permease